MTKSEIKRIDGIIAKHQVVIAKDRDKLNDAISELEGLKESASAAWDALQDARDALSQLM